MRPPLPSPTRQRHQSQARGTTCPPSTYVQIDCGKPRRDDHGKRKGDHRQAGNDRSETVDSLQVERQQKDQHLDGRTIARHGEQRAHEGLASEQVDIDHGLGVTPFKQDECGEEHGGTSQLGERRGMQPAAVSAGNEHVNEQREGEAKTHQARNIDALRPGPA